MNSTFSGADLTARRLEPVAFRLMSYASSVRWHLCVLLAVAISGAVLSGSQSTEADAPPTPFEDVGACPFEGCVYRDWIANSTVDVRRERQTTAPVAYRVVAGEKVTALTGVVVTLEAGRVQFREPQEIATSDGPINIVPGQTLFLLTYQGEGFTKAWFDGRLYRSVATVSFQNYVCDVTPGRCTGRVIQDSQTVWWVQIRNAGGALGWTQEVDKFDGKDALAP